ncbi:MAG: hypothetical protein SGILL_002336 [Bacillariaceae sp.]
MMNTTRIFLITLAVCLETAEAFVSQPPQRTHQFNNVCPSSSLLSHSTRLFSTSSSSSIRFLGRGPNAIVRPGVVLLAPAEEFHHYLRQSAVYIYAIGLNEDSHSPDDEWMVRGVIVDHPTPFTMGEMMEVKNESGGVFDNLIYRGGDTGGESAFCLHSFEDLGSDEIGTSGIYQGGDLEKMDDTSKVKFFFNFMEFSEKELEDMLEISHEDGDCWTAVEVPPEIILDSSYDRGDAWARLRNAILEERKE